MRRPYRRAARAAAACEAGSAAGGPAADVAHRMQTGRGQRAEAWTTDPAAPHRAQRDAEVSVLLVLLVLLAVVVVNAAARVRVGSRRMRAANTAS